MKRPWGWLRLPHIPCSKEQVRSWYLFDFFATAPALAVQLIRQVAAEAADNGIAYLSLAHTPGDPCVAAARDDLPRLFSPLVPYRLLARRSDGAVPALRRLSVDIRDL